MKGKGITRMNDSLALSFFIVSSTWSLASSEAVWVCVADLVSTISLGFLMVLWQLQQSYGLIIQARIRWRKPSNRPRKNAPPLGHFSYPRDFTIEPDPNHFHPPVCRSATSQFQLLEPAADGIVASFSLWFGLLLLLLLPLLTSGPLELHIASEKCVNGK